jgi:hypothetical protein
MAVKFKRRSPEHPLSPSPKCSRSVYRHPLDMETFVFYTIFRSTNTKKPQEQEVNYEKVCNPCNSTSPYDECRLHRVSPRQYRPLRGSYHCPHHWLEEESQKTNYGELMDEMLLVSFVKRYNITREEFDAATAKFAENVKNDTHTEECEVPNGDILYTFDNEIINHYYRYE